jgi:ribosome-binding factor A
MSDRIRKINELVREEVSLAIAEEIGKEHFVTVMAVETSDDLKHSTIWVSVMGDEEKALEELLARKSVIQHRVTGKMATKYTPKLEFRLDHSQVYVQKIEELLKNDK